MNARAPDAPATHGGAELAEAIDALRMPPAGLRRWLQRNTRFCLRHGGRRYYRELLDLYDECLAVLDTRAR
jgi:hypothetical protein